MSTDTLGPDKLETKSEHTVAITAAYVLVLVMICVGSIVATGFGVYRLALGSPVILRLSNLALSVEVTDIPTCTSLIPGCLILSPKNGPDYLVVWGAVFTQNGRGVSVTSHKILQLQLP